MKNPSITVLMALYNGGEYLQQSVQSILDQTHSNFEFLIINDCSTDNSLKTLESFNDERIKIHNNAVNIGQTKSLNMGLKKAAGEYIARIDADDVAFPRWLELQLKYIKTPPECTVVSTKAAVIDSANRIVKVLSSEASPENIILKSLIASPINHVGSLFQKNVILNHGGYDEDFKIAQDYDLWSRLLREQRRVVSTDEILMAIRVHEQSISVVEKEITGRPEMSRIMQGNMNWLTNMNISEKDVQQLWGLIYNNASLSNDQFVRANTALQGVYKNIRSDLGLSLSLINKARRKVEQIIYVKRIFSFIENSDVKGARLTALGYIHKRGILNLFSVIYIFSFLGIGILRYFPIVYGKFSEKWTRFRLMGRLNGNFK